MDFNAAYVRYKPTVTVITVVLNDAKHIAETISSVVGQTYPCIEYIIIDGNSHDGTLDVIREYEHNINFWVSEKDTGIYNAMNKGIDMSTGDLIGILNSGDIYHPQAVEIVVEHVQSYKSELGDKYIVTGAIEKIDADGRQLFICRRGIRNLRRLNWAMPINHPATFVSRMAYENFGLYDEQFKICADYEFVYRMCNKDVRIHYLKTVLTSMRIGGFSEQTSSIPRRSWEHFLIQKKYIGFPRAFTHSIFYFANTFPKTALRQRFPILAKGYYALKRKICTGCYQT